MKAYSRMLWLLRGRDPQEQRAIKEDAELLLEDARARGRGAVAATWLALMWDLIIVGAGHDLARAFRSLVRSPGFTLTVSLLLGLGVAATTTLFALINAVILKPLPYGDPEQLVMLWESNVPQNRLREGPAPGRSTIGSLSNDAFESLTGWWTARQRCVAAMAVRRCGCAGDERLLRGLPPRAAPGADLLGRRVHRQAVDPVRKGRRRGADPRAESSPVAEPWRAIRRWSEEPSSLKGATGA